MSVSLAVLGINCLELSLSGGHSEERGGGGVEGGREGRGVVTMLSGFLDQKCDCCAPFLPPCLPSIPLTNKELRKHIQHPFKGIRRALKFIKRQIHRGKGVGGTAAFVDEVLVGVLTRVLFGAEKKLGGGKEGREGGRTNCDNKG